MRLGRSGPAIPINVPLFYSLPFSISTFTPKRGTKMFQSISSSTASTTAFAPAFPARGHSRSRPRLARQRDSTVTAYAKDVKQFLETYGGTIPCTAEELIAYIRLLARRVVPATVVRRVMAIQDAHVQRGLALPTDDPRIREALRLMAGGWGGLQPLNLGADIKGSSVLAPKRDSRKRSAAPITRTLLTRMIDAMGTGARSLDRRDKAIFLLGFVGGLKRGTICALNIEDVTSTPDAMLVLIKAATDGEAGRTIAIPVTRGPLCAATAVHQWIAHSAMEGCNGPLFPRFTRSGEPVLTERLDSAYVSKLVKARLRDAGVEDVAAYSGESLRLSHAREFDGCRRS